MKRIVVIGGGESGTGAAILAYRKGYDVFLSEGGKLKEHYRSMLENESIMFEEGRHTGELILNADEIIKSPGVPYENPIIQQAVSRQIPIISEIEFAGRYTNATIIGITGTNGKTTTTYLTYHILKKGGFDVRMAGNVGNSFAMEVANNESDCAFYVLELSSFQLDGVFEFRPHIAILTNITSDHLDRYQYQMKNYVNAKFRIIQAQTPNDYFIYSADDPITSLEIEKRNFKSKLLPFTLQEDTTKAAYIQHDKIIINLQNNITEMYINELALQGKHNLYNSMAAAIAARLVDVKKESIRESLADFENIEHRLEFVAKVKGVDFINDSKATNVNSAWYALECMHHPVIWIAGGVDKGNDYSILAPLVKEKVKAIICLGKDNEKIKEAFGGMVETIVETQSMQEAVKAGYILGLKGDVVLLSPACASYDLFESYEARGHQFKQHVREL